MMKALLVLAMLSAGSVFAQDDVRFCNVDVSKLYFCNYMVGQQGGSNTHHVFCDGKEIHVNSNGVCIAAPREFLSDNGIASIKIETGVAAFFVKNGMKVVSSDSKDYFGANGSSSNEKIIRVYRFSR